jgi:hypothetical protein
MQVLMIAFKQKSTCFGQLLCPSSGVFYCTFGIGKFHAGFDDHFQAESGWKTPGDGQRRCPNL